MGKRVALWALAFLVLVVCCCSESPVPKIAKYQATVDYTKSVKELVESGRYDGVDKGISDANFNVRGFVGSSKLDFELVRFNKSMSTKDVLNYLNHVGLWPATVQELLVFGAMFPYIQRSATIIALGSSCIRAGYLDPRPPRSVPCLNSRGDSRTVEFRWYDVYDWSGEVYFLAVRR